MGPGSVSNWKDYFRTPSRGFISLTTGNLYVPPMDGRIGGEPYRGETDAEYQARLEAFDNQPSPPPSVTTS